MTSQLQCTWRFAIDVGGTFTDVVTRTPAGEIRVHKILSSGRIKGQVGRQTGTEIDRVGIPADEPADIWRGYRFEVSGIGERPEFRSRVVCSDSSGFLKLAEHPGVDLTGAAFELIADEPAPIVGIRYLLGIPPDQHIPPVHVRLGTTRGTNALLERKGARCALVTTAGFEDAFTIGNQSRPRLFDLAIERPAPLYEAVLGVAERIAADGSVLHAPVESSVRPQLEQLHRDGITALAVCFVNAFRNPEHEQQVGRWAREIGFAEISLSQAVSPLIHFLQRGDTALVNAYLNPILKTYLADLTRALPGSQLELMTSAGGLVPPEGFQGKDSILSGPAGGVVGFAAAAARAGFVRSIGFDMGGTSTDVARYAGQLERDYETEKAGVRIAAPILSIETVAAGGGSICHFDGVQLRVGPDSAGADPGPCCYGRNGPLTVTDMNVLTGRIPPERFPFALDLEAARQKLQTLCENVALARGENPRNPLELAEGFLKIANAGMARAIQKISTMRGYDPAEHVLVSFGGAGGLHACALARELQLSAVLIPPFAGVLSAVGIGQAERREYAQRAVLRPLNEVSTAALQQLFDELADEAWNKTRQTQPGSQERVVRCLLDMRYVGRETTLHIEQPAAGTFQAAYEQEHQRRFGFVPADSPIEIVAARVEVVVPADTQHADEITSHLQWTDTEFDVAAAPPDSDRVASLRSQEERCPTTALFWEGREWEARVWDRESLPATAVLSGPAIVSDRHATTFIEPGFSARVLADGALLLERSVQQFPSVASTSQNSATDPVLLEVFHHHFASIAEQMGETLRQTAHSTNVKERLDFSCAVFDAAGRLVANAPHIPVHLGAMEETVRAILQNNPHLVAGDVYVSNDPYAGGSHLPDVTVVAPWFSPETGQLEAVLASRAHHAEIGGISPGSMPPFSRNLAEEGVIIRNFQLFHEGADRFDEFRELLESGPYPSRNPAENLADLQAQLAANWHGVQRITDLVAEHGASRVRGCMQGIREAAAAKVRQALQLRGGQYQQTEFLDDGSPISVTIRITETEIQFDFTGTGPVLASNLNASRAIVRAAVMYVLRCLIGTETPLNAGLLDPVELLLPECLLNPPAADNPADCAAMVGGNVETSQRVVDVLLGALGLAAASQGTMNNLTFGNGQFGYYETICGGSGAVAGHVGCDAVHTHMTNTRLTDVEILESRYPVRLRQFRIRPHSGGAGEFRGGQGVIREIEFLAPLQVSVLSQRRGPHAPFGMQGGGPGTIGKNSLWDQTSQTWTELPGSFQRQLTPGDRLRIETPGGGGWGRIRDIEL